MSPLQVAKDLGISKSTVLKLIRSGKLEALKIERKNGYAFQITQEALGQYKSTHSNELKNDKQFLEKPSDQLYDALVDSLNARISLLEEQLEKTESRLEQSEQERRMLFVKALPPKTSSFWPFKRKKS